MLLAKSFFIGTEGKSYQFSKTEVINFCLHLKNSVFSTREVQSDLVVKFDVHVRTKRQKSDESPKSSSCSQENVLREVFANCGLNLGYSIFYLQLETENSANVPTNEAHRI